MRTGPKVSYCLRDLTHTRPMLRRSPYLPVYPACSTNPSTGARITLGTSVGWADIYPPSYPEQWIDVTGLRGCFAYVHIADPENGVYESDEDNNEAQVIVRLPFRAEARREGCRGPRPREVPRPAAVPLAQPVGPKRSVRTRPASKPASSSSWLAASTNPFEPHTNAVPALKAGSASKRGVDPPGVAGPARRRLARERELRVVAELVGVDHVVAGPHRVDQPHRQSGIVRRRWRSIAISGTTPEPPPTSSTGASPRQTK